MGTLTKGKMIDRYGHTGGQFLADAGTPFEERALPTSFAQKEFHTYEVRKPIRESERALAEPWFGQPGGGIQHELPESVQYYLDKQFLVER